MSSTNEGTSDESISLVSEESVGNYKVHGVEGRRDPNEATDEEVDILGVSEEGVGDEVQGDEEELAVSDEGAGDEVQGDEEELAVSDEGVGEEVQGDEDEELAVSDEELVVSDEGVGDEDEELAVSEEGVGDEVQGDEDEELAVSDEGVGDEVQGAGDVGDPNEGTGEEVVAVPEEGVGDEVQGAGDGGGNEVQGVGDGANDDGVDDHRWPQEHRLHLEDILAEISSPRRFEPSPSSSAVSGYELEVSQPLAAVTSKPAENETCEGFGEIVPPGKRDGDDSQLPSPKRVRSP